MTADPPPFQLEVFQNQYLPVGGNVVDAVVTVTASGNGTSAAPTAAQIIMIDCSGSMDNPGTKMAAAKAATATAIDTLRDGVEFAVIAGRADAQMVYPYANELRVASPQTRAEAKRAVAEQVAHGGTAIGTWLSLANQLFARSGAEMRHAIMLTDGRDQHETRDQLTQRLRACEGRFVCDSRGIGNDWIADELRLVASTLLGTADGLEDPRELPAAFAAMTSAAMGKALADVSLRVWTPAGATIRFVKQAFPSVEDLTGRRTPVSERIGDYPTGAWGDESRDYHISVAVAAGAVGEEMLAARVSLATGAGTGATVLAQALVLATWTEDTALSTKINQRVAHYTGQAELAAAIQEGLAAREAGDVETATSKLGRAVQLAAESGHEDTAKLLARVVDVVDERTGTVRLKQRVAGVDAEIASVRSVKTIRVKKATS
ncbi:MAG TPA: VWA domain-containing protein [Micromonosporaceae bacterium]